MRLLECSASIVFMRKFGRLEGYYDAYGHCHSTTSDLVKKLRTNVNAIVRMFSIYSFYEKVR